MKKFNVVVNGESFEVEIEEVGGASAPAAAAAPAPAKAPAAAPAAAAAAPAAPAAAAPAPAAKAAPGSGRALVSPLPGTCLDIRVKEGQTVKYADIVAVIEAMKMENEIPAGMDGVVTSIQVHKGDSLQAGDVILYIA